MTTVAAILKHKGYRVTTVDPALPIAAYRDSFGNWCSRIVAPAGLTRIASDAIVRDPGVPDAVVFEARQTPIQHTACT